MQLLTGTVRFVTEDRRRAVVQVMGGGYSILDIRGTRMPEQGERVFGRLKQLGLVDVDGPKGTTPLAVVVEAVELSAEEALIRVRRT